jgi:hypothetical protein
MFTEELSELITRLVKQIPYDYRRRAMGDVVQKGNRVKPKTCWVGIDIP